MRSRGDVGTGKRLWSNGGTGENGAAVVGAYTQEGCDDGERKIWVWAERVVTKK